MIPFLWESKSWTIHWSNLAQCLFLYDLELRAAFAFLKDCKGGGEVVVTEITHGL